MHQKAQRNNQSKHNEIRQVQWNQNTGERGYCLYLNLSMFFRGETRTYVIHKMKANLCKNSNSLKSITFVKKSSILDVAMVLDRLMLKARIVEQNNRS